MLSVLARNCAVDKCVTNGVFLVNMMEDTDFHAVSFANWTLQCPSFVRFEFEIREENGELALFTNNCNLIQQQP